MKIILGSSSKYRKKVIEDHGFQVETMNPDIDEMAIRSVNHYELPLLLARAKAEALLPKISHAAILITADIIAIYKGELKERPKTEKEARAWLAEYSEGHPIDTVCGVVVINTKTGARVEGVDICKVYFNPLSQESIDDFIEHGDPLSRGGGFGIQYPSLAKHISKIDGTVDSIVGLPMTLVKKLIDEVQ